MAKVLSCKDLDPSVECDFTARGKTMEDVMRKAAEHGTWAKPALPCWPWRPDGRDWQTIPRRGGQ